MERLIKANDVELCTETFGDPSDPPILLIGATMLTWPDAFCERLAALRRFVVRYDLRDVGRSTTVDPDAPGYTLRDLVADAAALLDALNLPAPTSSGRASAAGSPSSSPSTTRNASPPSRSSAPARSRPARSTPTCPTTSPRSWKRS